MLKLLVQKYLLIGLGALCVGLFGKLEYDAIWPAPQPLPIDATVSITDFKGTTGGTGVVISTSSSESTVLTNKHVCQLVQHGGLVHSKVGVHIVDSYFESNQHDLCALTVSQDLKTHADVAESAPKAMDEATTIGHPLLLPTIVSKGYFLDKKRIALQVGSRPCTEDEKKADGVLSEFFCMISGMPVYREFDSIVVYTTIQPGSSGSAVYNSDHKIAALIFAGSSDFGYGLAVPHEYIVNFLRKEIRSGKFTSVNSSAKE